MLPLDQINPDNVLALVRQQPTSLMAVAQSRSCQSRKRRAAQAAFDQLTQAGLVRQVYLEGERVYVPTEWRLSDELLHLQLMGRTRQCGDCLEWLGYVDPRGVPVFTVTKPMNRPDLPAILRPRRFLWNQTHRSRVRDHELLKPKCGNDLCINPVHMVKAHRCDSKVGRPVLATHRLAIVNGVRASSKLNMDAARAIRASDEPSKALAERYGVTSANINMVRRNLTWREVAAHPFAGLVA